MVREARHPFRWPHRGARGSINSYPSIIVRDRHRRRPRSLKSLEGHLHPANRGRPRSYIRRGCVRAPSDEDFRDGLLSRSHEPRSMTLVHGVIDDSDITARILFPTQQREPFLPLELVAEPAAPPRTEG